MKRLITIMLSVFILHLFQGCLERNVAETDLKLTSSLDAISATAEFLQDSADSVRTVRIISNRSWYAHLNEPGDVLDPAKGEFVTWGKLDVTDHANLTNVTDTVEINVIFARNYSETPVNGVLNLYSEGRIMLSVPVQQEGAVYRLAALADKLSVSCMKDTVRVFVDCNTSWTASLSEETTADVVLGNESGFDPDTLLVIFNQNLDPVNVKTATVTLSASSCEDCTINISQDTAVPYLELSEGVKTDIIPGTNSAEIAFRTNCNWTLRADDSATLTDIVFEQASGGPSSDEIKVRFTFINPGDDPSIVNSARIILSADGTEDIIVDYSQRASLILDFYNQTMAPYGLLTDYASDVYDLTVTTSKSVYKIPLNHCKFRTTNNSHGLHIPNNGYIGIPGIEGMRITSVNVALRYHNSFKKIYLYLCSSVEDRKWYTGVLNSYVIAEDWEHTFYSGKNTDPEIKIKAANDPIAIPDGKGCLLICDKSNINNLVKTITIVYEPAE